MKSKTALEESEVENTIRRVSADSFTVLDFISTFKKINPEDWGLLVQKFGVFGGKK